MGGLSQGCACTEREEGHCSFTVDVLSGVDLYWEQDEEGRRVDLKVRTVDRMVEGKWSWLEENRLGEFHLYGM